ncbi:DUF434 domain-containing protein [Polluticaenibacter yanchengensis]|uniref:DUF434 domain-containing protein n=1 Tax=Polluticaenibacter yanchengensis TaxID=3014562 RepID=A0ABT4UFM9_9BACT|nr:DUF434 domain-containing protein [Chitinophagaceae bacterium LY-5]
MNTRNRGRNSGDDLLFGNANAVSRLKEAVADMHYLLSRGFAEKASAELVGNRYRLRARQIQMLKGAAASREQLDLRLSKALTAEALKDKIIYIDGFNLVILLESLLSGAYIFQGLDKCYRDLSSVHGSYKRVNQTQQSIELVAGFHKRVQPKQLIWILDKPVSNSGRLKQLLLDFAASNELDWEVHLEFNPDKYLVETGATVITSDAWVLDHCKWWFNMIDYMILTENLEVNLFSVWE